LSAALSLTRARRRVLVFDAGDPRNARAAHMHGVLGHDGLPPGDLRQRGRAEISSYGGGFIDEPVVSARVVPSGFEIFGSRTAVTARQLVVATGLRDELPAVLGLSEQWGRGVLVCPYCDGWERRNDTIGILATGPQGVDQAQQLRQWSSSIVYFPNDLGEPSTKDLCSLELRDIRVERGRVRAVRTRDGRVEAVELLDRVVPVDTIFTSTTMKPRDELLRLLGARTREHRGQSWIAVDADGRTSVTRLWAVGNVIDPRSNVSVSLGAGSLLAGAVNADLTAADIARCEASATPAPPPETAAAR
jgi:thioredoxin reductase